MMISPLELTIKGLLLIPSSYQLERDSLQQTNIFVLRRPLYCTGKSCAINFLCLPEVTERQLATQ